jgi:hypothetical protein
MISQQLSAIYPKWSNPMNKTKSRSNSKNKVLSLQQLRQARGGAATVVDNPNVWSTYSVGCPDNDEWSTMSASC